MSNTTVSIVIPTYNNQDTIAVCLASIEQQTYDEIEIIVVDGGSDDLTRNICRQYELTLLETDLGMAAARIEGAQHASGGYLFHVDSDMELAPSIVEECVQLSNIYDALIIPEINVGNSYWAQCTDIGKAISRETETGNLRFLPRELYFRVGGHNPELLGKEDEELHNLILSMGASIGHTESPIRHHLDNIGFLDIIFQRWKYMRSLSAYNEHARIDNFTPNPNHRASKLKNLLKVARERPYLIIGYLVLQISTGILSKLNEALR